VIAVAATVAVLAACATTDRGTGAAPTTAIPTNGGTVPPATVAPPPATAADPGTVVEASPIDPPAGARAWRIRYHSTAASGADIGVTGLLVVPDAPVPPGGFPLVTWAHPTTGAADGCEPSDDGARSIPFVEDLVADGWAVVATDYEGLGSDGVHPYLVGDSEGHTVLDAARAASRVDGSGVEPASPTAIWGFSQGGHAAAFAAQLAPTYAPELDLVGVAVAAPVSDVVGFTARAEGMDDQLGVVLTVVNGFAAAYPELDPASVLTPAGLELLAEVEHRCIGEINEHATRPPAEVIARPPTEDAAFAARFEASRAGDAPVGVPVLVVQGADDDIVDPAATAALVERWCALGVDVESVVRPGVDHGVLSADPYLGWLADRFAGRPTAPTC
jgi:alpha-beta hydrolase superfamily lysophospholipase